MLHEMGHNLGAVQGGRAAHDRHRRLDGRRARHGRVGRHVLRRRRLAERALSPSPARCGPTRSRRRSTAAATTTSTRRRPPARGWRRTGTCTPRRCSARAPASSRSPVTSRPRRRRCPSTRRPPRRPAGAAAPYAVTLTGTNATQCRWRVDGGAVRTGAGRRSRRRRRAHARDPGRRRRRLDVVALGARPARRHRAHRAARLLPHGDARLRLHDELRGRLRTIPGPLARGGRGRRRMSSPGRRTGLRDAPRRDGRLSSPCPRTLGRARRAGRGTPGTPRHRLRARTRTA